MVNVIKALTLLGFLAGAISLSGCAFSTTSEEAMQRANRALEQAELCNERVDRLTQKRTGK